MEVETVALDGPELAAAATGERSIPPQPEVESRLWIVSTEEGSVPVSAEACAPPNGPAGPLVMFSEGRVVAVFAAGEWRRVVEAAALAGGQGASATAGRDD